jgi:hypothetical protein
LHKPKLITKIINIASIGIAFNQEIGQAVGDFNAGTWQTNPAAALSNLLQAATGVMPNGQVNYTKLTTSAYSKLGGYVFGKVAKAFVRHFKF